MAENAISGEDILFKIAEEVGELRGRQVTTANTTTSFTCASVTEADSFKYARARVLGKGKSAVSANTSGGVFTVSPAFSSAPAAGDVLELCWQQENKRGLALAAMNEAIRAAYPYWYRETVVDQSAATLTLASNTDRYALPTAIDALIAVGIQTSANVPIKWQTAVDKKTKERIYTVEGQAGAYYIRFHPTFLRGLGYHEVNTGKKLCLWYATREPELTALTSATCQLPLDYFIVAAEIYRRRELNPGRTSPSQLQAASIALPQIQQVAQMELQRLGIGKRPPNKLLDEAGEEAVLEQPQVEEAPKRKK